MNMYSAVCVLCWLLSILVFKISIADAVGIDLYVSQSNDTLKSDDPAENPHHVTVLEDMEFKIKVIFRRKEYSINHLVCTIDNNSAVTAKSQAKAIFIVKVTALMAGTWNCSIMTDADDTETRPRIAYMGGNFTVATCYIKVHVRVKRAPQILLVNNMIVPSYQALDIYNRFDHYTQYNYSIGDMVDVWCIPGLFKSDQSIDIYYNFAAKLDVMFDNAMKNQSDLGYGFRTILQEEHHNTAMVCTCTGPQDFTTIQVKFIQQYNNTKNIEYIKINNSTTRRVKQSKNWFSIPEYEFDYLFYENENLEIVCETQKINGSVVIGNDVCIGGKKEQKILTKNNRTISPIIFSICGEFNKFIEIIYVNLKILSPSFEELVILNANLLTQNVLMEIYDSRANGHRRSWLYYEFNEGDTFVPNCSVDIIREAVPVMVLYKLNGSDFEPIEIILTSSHDNMVLECSAIEMPLEPTFLDPTRYYKHIYILFRKRAIIPTATTITNDGSGISTWALTLLIILVVIIVGCASTIVCKMIKRGRKTQNLQRRSLPNVPPDYAVHIYDDIDLIRLDNGHATNGERTSSEISYDYAYDHRKNVTNLQDLGRARSKYPAPESPSEICTYTPMNPKLPADEYVDVSPHSKRSNSACNSKNNRS